MMDDSDINSIPESSETLRAKIKTDVEEFLKLGGKIKTDAPKPINDKFYNDQSPFGTANLASENFDADLHVAIKKKRLANNEKKAREKQARKELALKMYHVEGKSKEHIAKVLKVRLNTVRRYLVGTIAEAQKEMRLVKNVKKMKKGGKSDDYTARFYGITLEQVRKILEE